MEHDQEQVGHGAEQGPPAEYYQELYEVADGAEDHKPCNTKQG